MYVLTNAIILVINQSINKSGFNVYFGDGMRNHHNQRRLPELGKLDRNMNDANLLPQAS